jgi:membrane protein
VQQFGHDEITDRAAALTYYGVLSIFPGMLVLVSLLGLIGRSNTNTILANIGQVAPGGVSSFLKTVIHQVEGRAGAASIGAIVGLLIAIWSASGYVAGFMRAGNAIYEIEEGRPFYVKIPVRVGTTIALMLLLLIATIIVVVTGPVASQVGQAIGLGNTLVTVWDIAKWPVLVLIVSLMLAILYWAAPNVKHPGFRWLSPGGLVAVAVWIIASAAFALYVANFSSYNKTYGSIAAVVIFLVWLWITNVAILLGAELNAELERGRLIQAGHPADTEPFLEPRDTRKMQHT